MPAFAEGEPNVRPGKVTMMDTMPPACGARRCWRCSRSMPFPLLRSCAGAAGRGPMIQGQYLGVPEYRPLENARKGASRGVRDCSWSLWRPQERALQAS
jgi:hypothetical protein